MVPNYVFIIFFCLFERNLAINHQIGSEKSPVHQVSEVKLLFY